MLWPAKLGLEEESLLNSLIIVFSFSVINMVSPNSQKIYVNALVSIALNKFTYSYDII